LTACHLQLAVRNIGLCSTSDIITFDQSGHNLRVYLSSAGRKDLSIDTQIKVRSSVEHGICTTTCMLRNLSEKLAGKFPVTTLGTPLAIWMMLS